MSTLTINANFGKWVREPHKKKRFIDKNIVGIKVSGLEWPKDERQIRLRLQEYKPAHDYTLQAYEVTKIEDDPISVI